MRSPTALARRIKALRDRAKLPKRFIGFTWFDGCEDSDFIDRQSAIQALDVSEELKASLRNGEPLPNNYDFLEVVISFDE